MSFNQCFCIDKSIQKQGQKLSLTMKVKVVIKEKYHQTSISKITDRRRDGKMERRRCIRTFLITKRTNILLILQHDKKYLN